MWSKNPPPSNRSLTSNWRAPAITVITTAGTNLEKNTTAGYLERGDSTKRGWVSTCWCPPWCLIIIVGADIMRAEVDIIMIADILRPDIPRPDIPRPYIPRPYIARPDIPRPDILRRGNTNTNKRIRRNVITRTEILTTEHIGEERRKEIVMFITRRIEVVMVIPVGIRRRERGIGRRGHVVDKFIRTLFGL